MYVLYLRQIIARALDGTSQSRLNQANRTQIFRCTSAELFLKDFAALLGVFYIGENKTCIFGSASATSLQNLLAVLFGFVSSTSTPSSW